MTTGKVNIISVILAFLVAGCSERKANTLFVSLPSSQTGIRFNNILADHDSLNILDYLYYYNGGGVAVGDINNDGLPDIYFSANSRGHNKLYLNEGGFRFRDVTDSAGVAGVADWNTGVTMGDVNGDGWMDIYVCAVSRKLGLSGHNALYINNRDGTFTDSAAAYGIAFEGYSTQAAFFDYDHDGDLDCFLLNQSSHSVETFGDTSLRRRPSEFAGCRLYRNDINIGKRSFTDVTNHSGLYSSALGYGLGIAVADLDNDGWEDMYIGNDFHENDYYYINNHDGTFTESGAKHFNHYSRFSMGNDIADYDNDGQPDIVTLDMLPEKESILKTYAGGDQLDIYRNNIMGNGYQEQFSKNALQNNLGNGIAFSDRSLMAGMAATDWSWSPLLADYDNDGIKDLFISNGIVKRPVDLDYMKFISSGMVAREIAHSNRLDKEALARMPDGRMHNYIFRGTAEGKFIDESANWGMTGAGYSNGAAYADLDNDGRIDLVVNNINEEAGIYKNTTDSSKHFLSVSFSGNNLNTKGIGCKAYVFGGGKMQYQQLMLTRGFQSSSEARLHFGLDSLSVIDSVVVVWPGETFQTLKNVGADRFITIQQSEAKGSLRVKQLFKQHRTPLFANITERIGLAWLHRENDFVDFNEQYFIPHELSTAGPKLAIGDVNGDSLDDIYACGAKGQPGTLFIQTANGHFIQTDSLVFDADKICEDVDALFFDCDGDGDRDLYVVSGGNESHGSAAALADRLYLNDGRGHFTKSADALPGIYQNKSVVCAADVDHDGDMDLFVGVRADARAYGVPQTSFLLINDGHGKFRTTTEDHIALSSIGMVTSAAFADVNKDGWPDLLVAGEWMPVIIYVNNHGRFTRHDVAGSVGLWQSIAVADADSDGDPDIVAGNYGLNSKLHASDTAPLKLYVKDVDNNGRTDQIVTCTTNGKEYTFLGKDELERQLPAMKKKFLLYGSFAGKTVQEVFGEQLHDAQVSTVTTLATSLLINDGKGNFSCRPLPWHVQESPVFASLVEDINGDGLPDVMVCGNLHGVMPYEGRYDANWGDVLINKNHDQYEWLSPVSSGWLIRGEVRDIRKIRMATEQVFVVTRNNAGLLFFHLNK